MLLSFISGPHFKIIFADRCSSHPAKSLSEFKITCQIFDLRPKKTIFGKIFRFLIEFSIFTKTSIFDQIFRFLIEFSIFTKTSIFDQIFRFLIKFSIFDQNYDLSVKFRWLTKFSIFYYGIRYFKLCPYLKLSPENR